MSYLLTDFLVSLADPASLNSYRSDPETFMNKLGLSEQQKSAIRAGDLYRIRRLSALEMINDSLHAQLLIRNYTELDPDFRFSASREPAVEFGPSDVDTSSTTDHNSSSTQQDLGDDIAEFSERYNIANYYDHLFGPTELDPTAHELVFIGSGINSANQLTPEAVAHIKNADKVFYCVADLAVERRLQVLSRNTEDLYVFYADDKPRRKTYEEMVERMLGALAVTKYVCAVFYGHPGIFVWPSYRAIQLARKEGHRAYMLPAVSSLDCLFADVGFDPSRHGCQILE